MSDLFDFDFDFDLDLLGKNPKSPKKRRNKQSKRIGGANEHCQEKQPVNAL